MSELLINGSTLKVTTGEGEQGARSSPALQWLCWRCLPCHFATSPCDLAHAADLVSPGALHSPEGTCDRLVLPAPGSVIGGAAWL